MSQQEEQHRELIDNLSYCLGGMALRNGYRLEPSPGLKLTGIKTMSVADHAQTGRALTLLRAATHAVHERC